MAGGRAGHPHRSEPPRPKAAGGTHRGTGPFLVSETRHGKRPTTRRRGIGVPAHLQLGEQVRPRPCRQLRHRPSVRDDRVRSAYRRGSPLQTSTCLPPGIQPLPEDLEQYGDGHSSVRSRSSLRTPHAHLAPGHRHRELPLTVRIDVDPSARGQMIKRARRRRGYSQSVLAELIGRSESWLSQVERGKLTADSHEVLTRLARVLRIDVSQITGIEPEATSDMDHAITRAIERAMMRYPALEGSNPHTDVEPTV